MKSYLGQVTRRVTSGSTVEAFMWTRIDEDAYWNAYNPATYMSPVIIPFPATEQYLLWVTNSPTDPINGPQQVNSAPVLASLQTELGVQIAAGTGGTAPNSGGGSASGGGGDQSVPGPLPLLGLVAAFGWARRLRRVVRAARS
jgi:MYXO-CTERM domain-containing protein